MAWQTGGEECQGAESGQQRSGEEASINSGGGPWRPWRALLLCAPGRASRGPGWLPIFLFRCHCPHGRPSTPSFQPMVEGVPRPPRPHRQDSPGCAKKSRRVPRLPRTAKSRQGAPRHAQPCRDKSGWERQPPRLPFRPVRLPQHSHSTRQNSQHNCTAHDAKESA